MVLGMELGSPITIVPTFVLSHFILANGIDIVEKSN